MKGLEPSTFRVTGGRSNQLSYTPNVGGETEIRTQERVAPLPVFKTGAFNHSAISPLVEDKGIEPLTHPCHGCVIPFHQSPILAKYAETIDFFGVYGNSGIIGLYGAASRIRTADLLITNQLLYRLS